MATAKLYNQAGEEKGDVKLTPEIFAVEIKPELVHQAVVAQMANARVVFADTKDKSEVRGGGRKPWKQKGTGRARHGSIRSPLWRGGGVTFGPSTDRNYSKNLNKKMKKKALYMALSDKANETQIMVVDKLDVPEIKTKTMVEFLKNIKAEKRVMVVGEKMDITIAKSVRNLPKVQYIAADSLSVLEVIKANKIVFLKPALTVLDKQVKK